MHLVGFIIRIYHDARSSEYQNHDMIHYLVTPVLNLPLVRQGYKRDQLTDNRLRKI